ncbi:MAG: DUF1844 domain-containing protein [Candidatus Omnitrophica bacterium]|nr:DUF1844 domain-containing protein [Candidatus Omnitrophota bacterium]MBU1809460.1 DUF1844 domain-containing protein [Candidatus Omnitrophota bacterium]
MNEDKKEDLKKKVDESWKEAVSKDKTVSSDPKTPEVPEMTFGLFISGLLMEALIALGDAEHPVTKKKELSVPHAKFIIETLAMLKDKTKNNLSKEENDSLEAVLYDLRMRFVQKAGK